MLQTSEQLDKVSRTRDSRSSVLAQRHSDTTDQKTRCLLLLTLTTYHCPHNVIHPLFNKLAWCASMPECLQTRVGTWTQGPTKAAPKTSLLSTMKEAEIGTTCRRRDCHSLQLQ